MIDFYFFFKYFFFPSCKLSDPGDTSIFEPFQTQKCISAGIICLAHLCRIGGCGKGKEQGYLLQNSAGGRYLLLVFCLPLALASRVLAALLGVQEPSPSPQTDPLRAGAVETLRAFCTKLSLFQSHFQRSTGLGSNHGGQGCPEPQPGSLPLAGASSGWLF